MTQDWFWEGNVLSTLVHHLERQGWQVVSMADTEQDMSLIVRREDRELLVEVRGFPSVPLARGSSAGQPKLTRMSSKARQWYAHAMLGVMLKCQTRLDTEVALALPDQRVYRSLVGQTARALETLGVGVFLVSANGDVETLLEPAR
jgi:hypothetical protein